MDMAMPMTLSKTMHLNVAMHVFSSCTKVMMLLERAFRIEEELLPSLTAAHDSPFHVGTSACVQAGGRSCLVGSSSGRARSCLGTRGVAAGLSWRWWPAGEAKPSRWWPAGAKRPGRRERLPGRHLNNKDDCHDESHKEPSTTSSELRLSDTTKTPPYTWYAINCIGIFGDHHQHGSVHN